ncbi:hypothetical protein CIHG_02624 [Coccidioides immitis H538.4]|uniref:Uncharacterized protein n=2 Tax=Coccidioides immitis TaxID=5501 RepID=A0A0J8RI73_COCIT|nr:hypothetical protein CIRG_02951 [Coccidioides immitis RMSCC 2394]KMU84840.1 hypothetical protein CIHG_02624 [Coccidioides immitis H538.4]
MKLMMDILRNSASTLRMILAGVFSARAPTVTLLEWRILNKLIGPRPNYSRGKDLLNSHRSGALGSLSRIGEQGHSPRS